MRRVRRLLREIQVGRRGDWNRDRLQIDRTGFGGATISETFTLIGRGDRLVVRTTVSGPRGSREFTSVYERS